jgi:hypothetical protein
MNIRKLKNIRQNLNTILWEQQFTEENGLSRK